MYSIAEGDSRRRLGGATGYSVRDSADLLRSFIGEFLGRETRCLGHGALVPTLFVGQRVPKTTVNNRPVSPGGDDRERRPRNNTRRRKIVTGRRPRWWFRAIDGIAKRIVRSNKSRRRVHTAKEKGEPFD